MKKKIIKNIEEEIKATEIIIEQLNDEEDKTEDTIYIMALEDEIACEYAYIKGLNYTLSLIKNKGAKKR